MYMQLGKTQLCTLRQHTVHNAENNSTLKSIPLYTEDSNAQSCIVHYFLEYRDVIGKYKAVLSTHSCAIILHKLRYSVNSGKLAYHAPFPCLHRCTTLPRTIFHTIHWFIRLNCFLASSSHWGSSLCLSKSLGPGALTEASASGSSIVSWETIWSIWYFISKRYRTRHIQL